MRNRCRCYHAEHLVQETAGSGPDGDGPGGLQADYADAQPGLSTLSERLLLGDDCSRSAPPAAVAGIDEATQEPAVGSATEDAAADEDAALLGGPDQDLKQKELDECFAETQQIPPLRFGVLVLLTAGQPST